MLNNATRSSFALNAKVYTDARLVNKKTVAEQNFLLYCLRHNSQVFNSYDTKLCKVVKYYFMAEET